MILTGAKELHALLGDLPEKVQRKVMRKAMSAAATPIVKAARAKAAKRYGLLKKSLSKKVKAYKSGTTVAVIGPRSDLKAVIKGKLYRPSKIAHLIERGKINRNGTVTPPSPFLRPAYEQKEVESLDVLGKTLGEGIEREAGAA